ncbi:S-adenosyl-L-methionine-dependent methyltransferase [Obba rivulosa]|uniref:S-adenosyl-L-methionine-dependent methyltransferase n=1 Tax=Obba rivulosa TaxID=1052685 RepID=A0A8E2APN1_9APHY|nr:S-adenosyl-L-methionine-dependent methyltransferase [Obba rivulosa]
MATFAKATYDAGRYAAARPTYPRQLFDFVFQYHGRTSGARWERAVDLGCGTGQATLELTPFKHIVGIDPSERMITQASQALQAHNSALNSDNSALVENTPLASRVRFVQGPAESLDFLEDGSVDLIVSAQAAHWFDWARLWPEAARVLRKGGSLAVWGYSEFRLPAVPRTTPLIRAYAQGSDPATSLGPHWERPGRTIIDEHLVAIPDPPAGFRDVERVYFTGDYYPDLPGPCPPILRKRTTWAGLLAYLRTFSSLHTFQERFPADPEKPGSGLEERFWRRLRREAKAAEGKVTVEVGSGWEEGVGEEGEGPMAGEDEEVTIEWPMAMILARRV